MKTLRMTFLLAGICLVLFEALTCNPTGQPLQACILYFLVMGLGIWFVQLVARDMWRERRK